MLSRTPVVSSPSSSSKRRRERLCRAKATSSKPNASTTKTPVPETKKTDVMMSGKTQRRRDVFAVGVLFLSLGASSKESAFAYGTGGWKDCEPICDSLKGGFAAQQKLQEEMMRQSMGGDDTGAEAKEESKGKKAAVSEREKRKKNLR